MSSRSLNLVQLIGNLTRDPELRYTPQGTPVCTLGVATNRSWTSGEGGERQEETEYHRVVAWSKLAEICGQLLKKGKKVYVQGRLQTRKWTTKNGVERETTEIVADNIIILSPSGSGRNEESSNEGSYSYPKQTTSESKQPEAQPAESAEPATVEDVSDDIPF